jgi:hypothetical protein
MIYAASVINQINSLQVFDLEQQSQVIVAPRSNTELDVSKLLAEYPQIPTAAAAIEGPVCMSFRLFSVFSHDSIPLSPSASTLHSVLSSHGSCQRW